MLDFLVVGAGLSGATFAYLAKISGYSVKVIERKEKVGGMCSTSEQHGIMVHEHGAHIFHTSDAEVWHLLNSVCEFEPFINTPKACHGGRIFSLPVNMNTFNELWGVTTPKDAISQIQRQKEHFEKIENAEQYLLSTVGRDLYEAIFKDYTAKQWGRPCSELSPEIVKRVPIRFAFDNNYFNDKYQGIPTCGYSALILRMLDGVEIERGDYMLGDYGAKTVIYTGALDELLGYKYGELAYRSLEFTSEYYPDIDNYQGVAVVNNCDIKHMYTRTIEHKHFSRREVKGTIITHEVPRKYREGLERYYPITDYVNMTLYEMYKSDLPSNVIPLGRLAEYRYINMDEAVGNALRLFTKIK